jgi:hypothetical protein
MILVNQIIVSAELVQIQPLQLAKHLVLVLLVFVVMERAINMSTNVKQMIQTNLDFVIVSLHAIWADVNQAILQNQIIAPEHALIIRAHVRQPTQMKQDTVVGE